MKAGPFRMQKRGASPSAHLHPHTDAPLGGVSVCCKVTGEKWQNGIHPTEKEGQTVRQRPWQLWRNAFGLESSLKEEILQQPSAELTNQPITRDNQNLTVQSLRGYSALQKQSWNWGNGE